MAFTAHKAINFRLPTTDRLAKWGMHVDLKCKLCDKETKSYSYLFFMCDFSNKIMNSIKLKLGKM